MALHHAQVGQVVGAGDGRRQLGLDHVGPPAGELRQHELLVHAQHGHLVEPHLQVHESLHLGAGARCAQRRHAGDLGRPARKLHVDEQSFVAVHGDGGLVTELLGHVVEGVLGHDVGVAVDDHGRSSWGISKLLAPLSGLGNLVEPFGAP